jgi:hypothetical protein
MEHRTQDYAAVLSDQGAEFRGIRPGPNGAVILFADPQSRNNLSISEFEFSAYTVSRCLEESRRTFDLEAHVQKSLC